MIELFGLAFLTILAAIFIGAWRQLLRDRRRTKFIERYKFPEPGLDTIAARRSRLGGEASNLVALALKQYFLATLNSKFASLGLPSVVVEEFWRNFSLDRDVYDRFCSRAFGKPIELQAVSSASTRSQDEMNDLERTWRYCCLLEGIYQGKSAETPLLFEVDRKFGIFNNHWIEFSRPSEPDFGGEG